MPALWTGQVSISRLLIADYWEVLAHRTEEAAKPSLTELMGLLNLRQICDRGQGWSPFAQSPQTAARFPDVSTDIEPGQSPEPSSYFS